MVIKDAIFQGSWVKGTQRFSVVVLQRIASLKWVSKKNLQKNTWAVNSELAL